MSFIETIKARARSDVKTIVLPESEDDRTILAAAKVLAEGTAAPIIIGTEEEVMGSAARLGADLTGIQILDHTKSTEIDKYATLLAEIRAKKGMTFEKAKELISGDKLTFGIMMVKSGDADGLVSGACHTSADMLRPALQIIKTKPGNKIVSSSFIMYREGENGEEKYAMGDCAINLFPTDDELVEIAVETAKTAKAFGIDPKVAMLSYSTLGSGKGESVDKVRSATEKAKAAAPDLAIDGELQFDAAFSPVVAKTKCPNSPVAGQANTFIFPDINAGNIGYKVAQRFGGFDAFGPILQGLNAPINDLSRGCNADEVYQMAIITAGLK